MTAAEFEQKLQELDEEGNKVIAAAKKSAEKSTHLQQEITQGVDMLRQHYAQKMQQLISDFVKAPEITPTP